MKRIFALDVLQCRRCGGRRRIVGVYAGGPRLRELLARLGLGERSSRQPRSPPSETPPRRRPSPGPGPRPGLPTPSLAGLDGPG